MKQNKRFLGDLYTKSKALFWRGVEWSRKISLPGLDGLSLYEVGVMFWQSVKQGYITERAAGVAFNFLTALFPLLLFAFTVIPYLPFENFQTNLLDFLQNIIPKEVWNVIDPTVTYIVTEKKGNLLSIGCLLSLYFASNGINSLLTAFTRTYHNFDTYNFLRQRLNSLIILSIVGVMLTAIVMVFNVGKSLLNLIEVSAWFSGVLYYSVYVFRFILVVMMVLFIISFLYRIAVNDRKAFPLFSVGAKVASFLIVFTTVGFSFYISNWARYNILYGSLGTILILTMYIYLNAIFLLIGFDVNISIYAAKKKKNEKNQLSK